MTTPGRIGKVLYSDKIFDTFLGTMETEGAVICFRKRMKYSFESEWRSIRALHLLESRPGYVFVSGFDPASVREIIVGPRCAVGAKLRAIVASDRRYRHAELVVRETIGQVQ